MYTMNIVFALLTPGKEKKGIWADFKAQTLKISLACGSATDKDNRAAIFGRGYGEEKSIPEIEKKPSMESSRPCPNNFLKLESTFHTLYAPFNTFSAGQEEKNISCIYNSTCTVYI